MEHIYKYPLKLQNEQMVEMPQGAVVLAVQTQRETPCLWAQVDPSAPVIKRRFMTYGTGHPIVDYKAGHYVGTYQLQRGDLVFHVFTDRVEHPRDA